MVFCGCQPEMNRRLPSTMPTPLADGAVFAGLFSSTFATPLFLVSPCLLVVPDSRSCGASRVAQLEPFCDLFRCLAPLNDEALPAQERCVPTFAPPMILAFSLLGEACLSGVWGACHGVVFAEHETAWEPVPGPAGAVALAVVTDRPSVGVLAEAVVVYGLCGGLRG